MSTNSRPLFIYGTLCALPLLAWALTGEASQVDVVTKLLRKTTVRGYKRCSLHHRDFPAAVEDENSSIDGYLLVPQTPSQRRKLDDFEGEAYRVARVIVSVENSGGPYWEMVEADMYVWDGEMDGVSSEAWDLEVFIRDRLGDWIDLFEGMELVGDPESTT